MVALLQLKLGHLLSLFEARKYSGVCCLEDFSSQRHSGNPKPNSSMQPTPATQAALRLALRAAADGRRSGNRQKLLGWVSL